MILLLLFCLYLTVSSSEVEATWGHSLDELGRIEAARVELREKIKAGLKEVQANSKDAALCKERIAVLKIVKRNLKKGWGLSRDDSRGNPSPVSVAGYRGEDDDVHELSLFLKSIVLDSNQPALLLADKFEEHIEQLIKDDLDPEIALSIVKRILKQTEAICRRNEKLHDDLLTLLNKEKRLRTKADIKASEAIQSIQNVVSETDNNDTVLGRKDKLTELIRRLRARRDVRLDTSQ